MPHRPLPDAWKTTQEWAVVELGGLKSTPGSPQGPEHRAPWPHGESSPASPGSRTTREPVRLSTALTATLGAGRVSRSPKHVVASARPGPAPPVPGLPSLLAASAPSCRSSVKPSGVRHTAPALQGAAGAPAAPGARSALVRGQTLGRVHYCSGHCVHATAGQALGWFGRRLTRPQNIE